MYFALYPNPIDLKLSSPASIICDGVGKVLYSPKESLRVLPLEFINFLSINLIRFILLLLEQIKVTRHSQGSCLNKCNPSNLLNADNK